MEAKIEPKPVKTAEQKRKENIKIAIGFFICLLLCTFVYSFNRINQTQKKCDSLSDSLRVVTSLVNDSVFPTLDAQSGYIAILEANTNNSLDALAEKNGGVISYVDQYKIQMAKKVQLLESGQKNISNQVNGFKGKIDTLEIINRPPVLDINEPDTLMEKTDTLVSKNKEAKPKRRFKISFGKIKH
ncbi:MAG: hypothetical protein WC564_01715 [Patescibacteria group bacterium]